MAKMNITFLYGRVSKAPVIMRDKETKEMKSGLVYVNTVRSLRPVEDGIKFVKHDYPLIITKEKEILDQMAEWKENDIVFIKGVVSSKSMSKPSFCPYGCQDENGNALKNEVIGNLIYITPIYVRKEKEFDSKEAAIEDLVVNREISNQCYVYGTLLQKPKLYKTKKNIQITQYRIAINRKYTIRTDDVTLRTDYPVVKSYGEQALDDFMYLDLGSEIIVDGFLQARNVVRHVKCKCCEKFYDFKDHSLEIIPYDTEYVKGFRTKEDLEEEHQMKVEEAKQMLFNSLAENYTNVEEND